MTRWNSIREQVEEYLNTRRRLGYQLKVAGNELLRFAAFADRHGSHKILTIDLAVEWAITSASKLNRARRLEMIRSLAKYCVLFEPETQIPPSGLLGPAHRRLSPYIYTADELSDLMREAGRLNNGKGLRPTTIQNLLGLLAATGLRISEALHLVREDVRFESHLLVVKETKFSKSRYVPLHPTTVQALKDYILYRDKSLPATFPSDAFFLLDNGCPLSYRQALYAFQIIRGQIVWRRKHPPRIHDLRHTFACNRLLSWYEEGVDVNNAILMLSIYLGHGKVTDTYWYLTGIPSLMAIAAERFERFSGGET
ncbi:MAG: tyrosine-type recombinase/integrase [Deltaproteobacteria bacterium]|nr:tyrosine-type recombinase/integrase [Deltaproteobacteria bacterium]